MEIKCEHLSKEKNGMEHEMVAGYCNKYGGGVSKTVCENCEIRRKKNEVSCMDYEKAWKKFYEKIRIMEIGSSNNMIINEKTTERILSWNAYPETKVRNEVYNDLLKIMNESKEKIDLKKGEN
jgi:hypothetical protein